MDVFWNCQGVIWPTPKWQAIQWFTAHTPQQIRVLWGCKNPRVMEAHLASHPIFPYRWWLWNRICGVKICPPPAPSLPRILWNIRRLEGGGICRYWPRMKLCLQEQWPHMPPRNQRIYWNMPSIILPQELKQTSALAPQASWNSLWRKSTSGPRGSG